MKFGVVVFPGSNCDHDCYHVLKNVLSKDVTYIWHKETSIDDRIDCIVLPGGFSYGDYLRTGAIARFSPVMAEIERLAKKGKYVIGICNGFQILCEAGLLPGVLMMNASLKFICRNVHIRVENTATPFTKRCTEGEVLKIPIAHKDGNYFVDGDTLKRIEDRGQILFRYSTPDGTVSGEANPNGSVANIAGVMNEGGNVMGMMPHPERVCEPILGGTDGLKIFTSVIESLS